MSLLHKIAQCPNIQICWKDGDLACSRIVQNQQVPRSDFQVPEPWSGHIESAPVLFLSSNPSISDMEDYPRVRWREDRLKDFFDNRFGEGKKEWVKDGTKTLQKDGTHARATPFWAGIRRRAQELFDREVRPGIDYALTEVVHCKSREEAGVPEAQSECVRRYLQPVMNLAGARVIFVVGARAQQVVGDEFEISAASRLQGPIPAWGKERMIVFIPHPNSRAKCKTLPGILTSDDLGRLRSFLG